MHTTPTHKTIVHKTIEPTILYFGTPVALISTLNPDGSPNRAPMSSAWWLGWSCMLGLGQMGQTSDNLIRTRECVINLPSEDLVKRVESARSHHRQESRAGEETQGGIAMNQTNSVSPGLLRSGRNR